MIFDKSPDKPTVRIVQCYLANHTDKTNKKPYVYTHIHQGKGASEGGQGGSSVASEKFSLPTPPHHHCDGGKENGAKPKRYLRIFHWQICLQWGGLIARLLQARDRDPIRASCRSAGRTPREAILSSRKYQIFVVLTFINNTQKERTHIRTVRAHTRTHAWYRTRGEFSVSAPVGAEYDLVDCEVTFSDNGLKNVAQVKFCKQIFYNQFIINFY